MENKDVITVNYANEKIHQDAIKELDNLATIFIGNKSNLLNFVVFPTNLKEGKDKEGKPWRFYLCNVVLNEPKPKFSAKRVIFKTETVLEIKQPVVIKGYIYGVPRKWKDRNFYTHYLKTTG